MQYAVIRSSEDPVVGQYLDIIFEAAEATNATVTNVPYKQKQEDVKMVKFIYLPISQYAQIVAQNFINVGMIEIIFTFLAKVLKNFMVIVHPTLLVMKILKIQLQKKLERKFQFFLTLIIFLMIYLFQMTT